MVLHTWRGHTEVCQPCFLSQALLRQVQVHEPILVTPDSSSLKSAVEHTFAELSKAGVPINLVTFYDDLGSNYEWVVKLPVCPPYGPRQACEQLRQPCHSTWQLATELCTNTGTAMLNACCCCTVLPSIAAETVLSSFVHQHCTIACAPLRTCLQLQCSQVQAISLDFLGVPGSVAGNATAELISKHGFPKDKRLGAGIIDGRSVYGDHSGGGADLASALLAQASSPC